MRLKTIFTGAVATVGVGLGIATAGTGVASADEGSYLQQLINGGITITDSRDAIQLGYNVCDVRNDGHDVVDIATVVGRMNTTLTDYQAGWVVGTALRHLC